jgi:hypothetical protein
LKEKALFHPKVKRYQARMKKKENVLEMVILLRCCIVQADGSLPTFQKCLLAAASGCSDDGSLVYETG